MISVKMEGITLDSTKEWIYNLVGEPATDYTLARLDAKEVEFRDWLKKERLDYILESNAQTELQLKAKKDIQNILWLFEACRVKLNEQILPNEYLSKLDDNIVRQMESFSDEWKEEYNNRFALR